MDKGMQQAKDAQVIAQTLANATEALSKIFDLVKILPCQLPRVCSIDPRDFLVSRIRETFVVFAHEFLCIKQEPAPIPGRDAALGPRIEVERFINKHAGLTSFDQANVDVPVFAYSYFFVIHTNGKKL